MKQRSTRRGDASGPVRADKSSGETGAPAKQAPAPSTAAAKAERLGELFVGAAAVALLLAMGVRWSMSRTTEPAPSLAASAPPMAATPPMPARPRPAATRIGSPTATAVSSAASPSAPTTTTARASARPPAQPPAPPKGKGGAPKPPPYVPDGI